MEALSVCIVIPAYNEEECLPELLNALQSTIEGELSSYQVSVIIVDDHSTDSTPSLLAEAEGNYPWLKAIRLLKNSGSHIAIYAGLKESDSDVVYIMGADLQATPDIIPDFIDEYKKNYSVVLGERAERDDHILKKIPSGIFNAFMTHFVLKHYPVHGGDVFLIDRKIVDAVVQSRERNVNIFVLILCLCDDVGRVSYSRKERFAGHSKWSFSQLVKLAYDSVIAVGFLPLKLIFWFGVLTFVMSNLLILYLVIGRAIGYVQAVGWASVLTAIAFFGGVTMISISILGEYLWRSFDQTRERPLYILEPLNNFHKDESVKTDNSNDVTPSEDDAADS